MSRNQSERGAPQLFKRPESPNWQIRWYDSARGKVRTRSTETTEHAQANKQLARFIIDLGEGRDVDQIGSAEAKATFRIAEVVKAYYDQHASKQAQADQVHAVVKHMYAFFGDDEISVLADDDAEDQLQEYVWWRMEAGRSMATVKRELATLRAAMNALKRGNPGLEVPDIIDLPEADGRVRWLTKEEVARLMGACEWEHTRLFIELGMATGARAGAIYALKWDQVDFGGDTIFLNPHGRAQTSKKRPKVRMTPRIKAVLEGVRQHNPDSDFVIELARDSIGSIKKSFRTAVIRAGLDPNEVTPHTLRHTAASWMVQAGISLKKVASFLGHKDTRMVEKHYGHLDPDYQDEAVEALDAGLDGVDVSLQKHLKWVPINKRAPKQDALEPLGNLVEPIRIELTTSTMPFHRIANKNKSISPHP